MTEVILHVYDVTNSGNEKTNSTIMHINKIFKDGIGLGGIFHSAVQWAKPIVDDLLCKCSIRYLCDRTTRSFQVDLAMEFIYGDDEWSFGFCERGTGVFSCPSTKNPMYTYRESIKLGETSFSIFKVNQILRELSREWPGHTYDLLSKNCNHFCNKLCEKLGVPKLPGWVNRFAHAGDAAAEIAGVTAYKLRQAKAGLVSAGKATCRFFAGLKSSSSAVAPESVENSTSRRNHNTHRFHANWFKSIVPSISRHSTSSESGNGKEENRAP